MSEICNEMTTIMTENVQINKEIQKYIDNADEDQIGILQQN